jgi:hypothetical protein
MQTSTNENAIRRIFESADRVRKIQRDQAGRRLDGRRMRRQTHTIRERFVSFGDRFLAVFGFRAKKRKATANPIPVRLRPWTPRNLKCSADEAYRLLFELRSICTKSQYTHLLAQYPYLEQRAGVADW